MNDLNTAEDRVDLTDAGLAKAFRERIVEVCTLRDALEQRGIDVDVVWYQSDCGTNQARIKITKPESKSPRRNTYEHRLPPRRC